MKPRRTASIDGFVPRRTQQGSVDDFRRRTTIQSESEADSTIRMQPKEVGRNDITESLQNIDEHEPEVEAPIKKRRFRLFGRRRDHAKHRTKFQKWRRRIILLVLLALLMAIGYFGFKLIKTTAQLTHGNLLSLIQPGQPLNTDDQGRTNILILGTSQDDNAHQDASGGGGMWLTDSIMLVSLDQKAHTVKMISIPRDLWVSMPSGCSVGYQAKINAVYECGGGLQNFDDSEQKASDYTQRDQQGAQALEASVKKVTGITSQYYVHVNYSVLQQAVDAVGGIQVDVQGDGASGIYDTNFDWDCLNGKPYTCKNVYYPHDGTYTLDGLHALYLARARGDYGALSYKDFGLARGDFDRQLNQQKILSALQKKILSTGTLLNPVAVTDLLSALGNNITTDIQGGNYKTLIEFMKKMPKANAMQNVSLGGATGGEEVVHGDMIDGQSVEVPTAGVTDFTQIISYIAKQLSSNPAASENASIAIYNASGTTGVAATLQTKLEAAGLNVVSTGNVSVSDAGTTKYTVYDTSRGKLPLTISYLQSSLSGAQVSTQATPADLVGSADIIIVIGK